VLDIVGGSYVARNLSVLAVDGRLVQIGLMEGAAVAEVDFRRILGRRLTITGSTLRPRSVEEKGQIAASLLREVWPLLEAGVKVYEWNGSMIHAKTAVADGRWARVGSSNLNLASWLTNCEIDVAVENEVFAAQLAEQYLCDLDNATEVVLDERLRPARTRRRVHQARGGRGSSSRAAAGTLRLVNTVGAAIDDRRALGSAEAGLLPPAALLLIVIATAAAIWPRIIAWPLALLAAWVGASLLLRWRKLRRDRKAPESKASSPSK